MKEYTRLDIYVRDQLAGASEYESYRPRLDVVRRIEALLPEASVTIVTSPGSAECRREIGRFARILDHLAGWKATVVEDDFKTRQKLAVARVPAFVIQSAESGRELGRIVLGPISGNLEGDLLTIAEQNPSQIIV